MSFWLENGMTPGKHILIDCGNIKDDMTKENYDKLEKYLGIKNFEVVGQGELVARVPPSKLRRILEEIPEVKEETKKYCWCTYGMPRGGEGNGRTT